MCVIMHKPAGVEISEKDLRSAHRVNNDGFGFMYYDKTKQKIIAHKRLVKNPDEILEIAKTLTSVEACYHFRIKTHGAISDQACHPFKVTDKKKHGMEIYFMHNGVISGMKAQENESDTQAFNNNILFPLLKHNPKFIETDACRILIEKMIGTGNKLCFMYGDGKVIKFNENMGDKYEGMWVSNKNFVTYNYQRHWPNTSTKDDTEQWREEMAEYYANGYGGGSCYNRNTNNNKTIELNIRKKMMGNVVVNVGDTLYIWRKDDNKYGVEGKILSLTDFSAMVKFVDKLGITIEAPFFFATSASGYQHPGYECISANVPTDAAKTVEEMEGKVSKEETKVKEDSIADIGQESLALEDHSKKSSEPVAEKVMYGTLSLDPKSGWGGMGLEDSLASYNEDGLTILDVYNMSYQDRFTFFLSKPKISFLMFQDLVEKLVLDDVDSGLIETDEAVPEDKDQEKKDEAILDAANRGMVV